MTKLVALVILDGWGLAPAGPGNAVELADTPVFDALWELPRDARPVEDWIATASLQAARRIDPEGMAEAVSADWLNEQWTRQRARHPDDFEPESGFESLKTSSGIKLPPSSIRPIPVR